MKSCARFLVLLVLAGLAAGCGDDAPAAKPAPEIPPSVDPEAYRQFQEAPTPPPVAYGESKVREEARVRGLFADLPAGDADHVLALLKALPAARQRAEAEPGRWGGGAAGPSYEPSDAEIVLAEIGRRIVEGLEATPTERHASLREEAGLDEVLVIPTLRVVTVKVFGTGYVETIEPTSESIRFAP